MKWKRDLGSCGHSVMQVERLSLPAGRGWGRMVQSADKSRAQSSAGVSTGGETEVVVSMARSPSAVTNP